MAAEAMGKDVTAPTFAGLCFGLGNLRPCGCDGDGAGWPADGDLLPINRLRWTFLIWVMVIVGGSGSNLRQPFWAVS